MHKKIKADANRIDILPNNNGMRTSTKILLILSAIMVIPNIFLMRYLFAAIEPTAEGFVLSFTPLAWGALASMIVFLVLLIVLFVRFLRTQRLTNVIFFSVLPLTLAYGAFMVYVTALKSMEGATADSVRATLNIQAQGQSYNQYLWAGLATIVYLLIVFLIILASCRPLRRVEKVAQTLGDGRMKFDDFRIGGGKQFKEIEYSLNKINYNYKEKENKLRQTNLEAQKFIPKEFFKFLGKSSVSELELGNQVKKHATLLFCDLKSARDISKALSLEENFNYINSYLKVVAPLIKRFDGFIDKYLGDGVLAVFSKPQNAIECGHAILKTIDMKNKAQKELPDIEARIAINTCDIIFGIIGDEERKSPTIVSDVVNLATKMGEINLYIGTKLLVAKQTLNELPQNYKFDYRYTGTLSVEGLPHISLFESLEYYSKSKKDKLKKVKNKFEESVRAYNERDYKEAKTGFEIVLKSLGEDGPSFVYFNKAAEKLKEEK